MGDPKKPRKKWEGPRHPWRKEVLVQELKLLGTYGLRNKRELWRAQTIVRKFRHQARSLLAAPQEIREQTEKALLNRLYRLGLLHENATLEDVLGLTVEDLLERRLQTIVYKKGLARTIYHARQLIVHGHIAIAGRRVTSPGYIVSREEEELVDYAPTSPLKKSAEEKA
ncbi:30S ribosomal protein S4 [Staphylothermus hellenicus]|uniref:Small ribosomal subunit protein uS4 n=1 Tax=Staphylothermus hellenicus (strain DSM 12710 / JCM 10830 / BK20S6-10-b1 / P8) TaxID=591019 RepID=D7DAE3_STAHD|nr:30S ribosomal protein S4 [Staphylothermus hellenicus]ADI32739.1 ribosomal protein S4 [Staphylothermus hellenicus DSM 12710]